jgi:hypothetical protein
MNAARRWQEAPSDPARQAEAPVDIPLTILIHVRR